MFELGGGHAGVSRHDDLHQPLHSRSADGFHVVFEYSLEGLLGLPLRVLGCELLHAIEREKSLRVHGIFDPQGAVVIEGGDAVGRFDVILALFVRYGGNELQDRLLRRPIVPRWQRIGGVCDGADTDRENRDETGQKKTKL